jgi:hypothetical protein
MVQDQPTQKKKVCETQSQLKKAKHGLIQLSSVTQLLSEAMKGLKSKLFREKSENLSLKSTE